MFSRILKRHILFPIAFLFCFSCEGVERDLEGAKNAHEIKREDRAKKKGLDRYLLPKRHPLHAQLKNLFTDPQMFQSIAHFQNAGFQVKRGHRQLMLGAHPSIPYHLVKKFSDVRTNEEQLANYIKRIKGANKLRRYIKKRNFDRLVVPQKWLYELPPSFSGESNTNAYALIVDKMDIYEDGHHHRGEARMQYQMMDKETLRQLCTTLHELGGCDAFPRNQPFTRSGQIAFVDTEHLGKMKGHFVKHIVPALSEENQQYALALWDQLEREEAARK